MLRSNEAYGPELLKKQLNNERGAHDVAGAVPEPEVEAWAPVPQGRGYEGKEAGSLLRGTRPRKCGNSGMLAAPEAEGAAEHTTEWREAFCSRCQSHSFPKRQPGAAGSGERPPRPELGRLAGPGGTGRTSKVKAEGRVLRRPAPRCLHPAALAVLLPTVPVNDSGPRGPHTSLEGRTLWRAPWTGC
uniref:Uncharacterized protein n=1 Tax=Rangifer tarandus platyrhynchus TaxID=3082113 RepID=A0ACB0EDA1_RANTA|nr:unnamed protein product [Rangifer tarandus platyrhynchus]